MKKITLNYDASTGNITLDDSSLIGSWPGITGHDAIEKTVSVDDLIALKKADFTVEEITDLSRKKLI